MKRHFILAVILPLVAGCDMFGAQGDPAPTASPQTPAPPTPPGGSASGEAGGAREVSEVTDFYVFKYGYPQKAGELPRLAQWLDARMAEKRTALSAEAARGQRQAREDGFPFNKYSSGTTWEVVADLPDYLSLSADLSSYQGGAHPNYGFDTMVWDKQRSIALEPIAFFDSPAALDEALGEQLCDKLNTEREKRRGIPVPEGSDDFFDACVKVDETNLLLGSTGGTKFDRIGVQIAPYLAGPYAEGSYEFTFVMTPELLEQVSPEYRAAFVTRN